MKMPLPRNLTAEEYFVASFKAMQWLYEKSFDKGDKNLTRIIGQALHCCDDIMKGRYNDAESMDSLLYLYFLTVILKASPEDMEQFVALMEWMHIIPSHGNGDKAQDFERKWRDSSKPPIIHSES